MTTEPDDPTASEDEVAAAHWRAALGHRTDIGIALGVVMTRLAIDQDAAFGYLRRVSSVQNRKLHAIASEIAETRRLPEV